MPNNPRDPHALCPFYEKSVNNCIYCEPLIDGTWLSFKFATREKTLKHLHDYCNTLSFGRCPYAIMLIDLYKEPEKLALS